MTDSNSKAKSDDTRLLVGKAKQGNTEALQTLFARYYERIRPLVRARLGQELRKKVETDDIVQTAFGAAFRSLDRFECQTEGAFLHWMSTIISHTICDNAGHYTARKRGGRDNHLGGSRAERLLAEQPASDPSPSKKLESREDEERLMSALDQLERNQKEMLIMLRFQHLAYREIGEILDIKETTVRNQIVKAERELAKIYAAMDRDSM